MANNNFIMNYKKSDKRIVLLIVLFCIVFCTVYCQEDEKGKDNSLDDSQEGLLTPVVNTKYGQIKGLERKTKNGKRFFSFKGIPYAEPPVNERRFKDPIPIKPWEGVKDTLLDGKYCPQINVVMGDLIGEEDCLFLNVYTPSLPKENSGNKKYPVVFNLHSGGFTMGGGVEDAFNPLVFIENNIVVVSINYRLGIFGFLSLDTAEVPGNAALKDQRLALLWVHENIHFFNGDSKNVTLFGMSAGSTSVEYQLLHPESKGLFIKASMQSGTTLASWARPRRPDLSVKKLADYLGVINNPDDILAHLKTLSTMEILDVANKANDKELHRMGYIFTQFAPVVEKAFPGVDNFITKDPLEIYKSGSFVKVPTLRTFCRDEGTVFQFMYGDLIDEINNGEYANFMTFLNIENKKEVNDRLKSLYKAMNVSHLDEVHEFLSDMMFLSGIYQSLKYITKDSDLKHYTYMFSYIGKDTKSDDGESLGKVPHTIDMSYFISLDDSAMSKEDLKIRNTLTSIFINFVINGDPTANGSLHWEPSTKENNYKILNIQGDDPKMIPFPFVERMKYWETLYQ